MIWKERYDIRLNLKKFWELNISWPIRIIIAREKDNKKLFLKKLLSEGLHDMQRPAGHQ